MDIKEKIEFHKNEIKKLEESQHKKGLEDYSYLIGKCFRITNYSMIKVHSVDYVFQDDLNYNINVSCLKIGKHEIDDNYSYNLNNSDLEDEITNEKFIEHLDNFVDNIKQKINE